MSAVEPADLCDPPGDRYLYSLIAAHHYFGAPESGVLRRCVQELVARGSLPDMYMHLVLDDGSDGGIWEVVSRLEQSGRLPSREAAAWYVGRYLSRRAVSGESSPSEAASQIVERIHAAEESSGEFPWTRPFAGLVSEYEDFGDNVRRDYYGESHCARLRREIIDRMLEAARSLLASGIPPRSDRG